MELKIKKLSPAAVLPEYATDGAACFDLCSLNQGKIYPHTAEVFGTGLSFEIPEGHVMLVFSRSGHGFKSGIRLVNSVGVIDSDYRGEVAVGLRNDSAFEYTVKADERIAQAMIIPVQQVQFVEVDELSSTERGAGGFGSTGK